MEGQTNGATGQAAHDGAARDFGPAAERLTAAIGDLDRRYGWSKTVKENPWPALAVAAGVGFALAETGLDRGARQATSEATSGVRSSAAGLVETLAAAATATVSQAIHGQLEQLVNELKQAIGAPTTAR
ncbi:MAG TPA: hypothetical protein VFN38_14805 [Gemmatimonadaceae bacterium]|nr:hypothetical protein [Gemmatimonadaceae bacterium]